MEESHDDPVCEGEALKRLLLKLQVRIDASPNRYFFYFCLGAAVILAIAIYDTFYLGSWPSDSSQLPP